MQQERNPTTVSHMMAQIWDVQNKVNYLSDAREFGSSWISEQLWSDPRSQSTVHFSESQNHASLRFWISAWYIKKKRWKLQKTFLTTTYGLANWMSHVHNQEIWLTAILDCRTIHGILWVLQESFVERPPAQERRSSKIFNISMNLASSSEELRHDTARTTRRRESEMKREPLNTSSTLLPHFQNGSGILNHTCGT